MKKFKNLLFLFLILSVLQGCNDDFLEEEAYGNVADNFLWNDKADLQQALNSSISNLDTRYGYFTTSFLTMEDGATDYWIGAFEYRNFPAWQTDYPSSFSWAVWGPMWRSIYYSNLVLERIDRVPNLTDEEKGRFEGQARFFRAFNYYFAQNKFGDVPIVTSVSDTRDKIPQSSREDVRKLIENDLIIAAGLLPEKANVKKAENQLSRPSKQAALGLLARLYINWETRADRWQKTSDVCDALMNAPSTNGLLGLDASLASPFSAIFSLSDEDKNKEIIYALEHSIISTTSGYSLLNTFFAIETSPAMKFPNASQLGWGDWRVTRDFYDQFDSNDFRRKQLLVQYESTSGRIVDIAKDKGALVTKYPLDSFNKNNAAGGNDQPLIRFSDIILMKAEAQNELGNLAVAIGLVNQIRNRAGLGNIDVASFNTIDKLKEEIYLERRREFFGEGLGRTDMIRFKLKGTTHKNEFLKWVALKGVPETGEDLNKYLVYPFDGLALRKNLGLVQNPGYLN